jgi:hypothetical protein
VSGGQEDIHVRDGVSVRSGRKWSYNLLTWTAALRTEESRSIPNRNRWLRKRNATIALGLIAHCFPLVAWSWSLHLARLGSLFDLFGIPLRR